MNYELYSSEIKKDETVADTFEVLDDYSNSLSFSSLPYERIKMKTDTILAEKRKRWKKALNKDMYLEEAVHILEDLELNFIPSKPLIAQQN